MPMLPAQSVRFASLAGAILLSIALIIHLHLLGSKGLPTTISSAPARPTLRSSSPLSNITQRSPQIEFSVAGARPFMQPQSKNMALDCPLFDATECEYKVLCLQAFTSVLRKP